TGETYRLPNESEVSALYKDRANENTLDYWAGYALNPEDAAKLEAEIKELPGDAPLLREVGTFPGQGEKDEELVFDLGGNVSEWAVAANGSPKTLGASADRSGDTKSQYHQADPAYTGFRVVHIAAPPQPAAPPAARPEPQPTKPTTRTSRTKRAPQPKPQPAPQSENQPAPEAPKPPDAAPAPETPSPAPETPNPAPDSQPPPSTPDAQPSSPTPDPSQTPQPTPDPPQTPNPNPQ